MKVGREKNVSFIQILTLYTFIQEITYWIGYILTGNCQLGTNMSQHIDRDYSTGNKHVSTYWQRLFNWEQTLKHVSTY